MDLHGQQRQLDVLGTRGTTLIQHGSSLPGFEASPVRDEVQNLQQRWQHTQAELHQGKETLEEQLVLWEQISSCKEEVSSWLDNTLHKLEDSAASFGDSVSVNSSLQKYKVREN